MNRRLLKVIEGTILSVLIIAGLNGCSTSPKSTYDPKDLSYLYNPLKNSINPRYSIFNQNPETSILSIKFFNTDLFFSEANPTGQPLAQMFLSVRLFNVSQGRLLADTAYFDLNIVKDPKKNEYLYRIPLKVEKATEYFVEIKVMDKVRQMMVQAFVPFNTLSDLNMYNFYVRGHFGRNELMRPIVKKDEYMDLVYGKHADSLYISVFRPYLEFPYPPSMVLPEKPGATEPDTMVVVAYSDTLPLMFPRKGIYFCSVSRAADEGYSIFNFGTEFPNMTTPETMMEPLVYLANSDEMSALRDNPKPKMALDDFWLACAGNVEKARELVRIYYTRVLYSNYYFTSYKEGWRTDRGMIYILYGPPDKLYKTTDEEKWGYRMPVVRSSWGTRYSVKEDYLYFIFKKRPNRFSDNEYSLSRSETVITNWDQAVLSWRKGIVFRLDNPAEY
jgi:GWxTD domain-containing protein